MTLARLLSFGAALVAAVMPLRADAGPTVLAKGFFSYQAPPGWIVLLHQDSNIPVAQTRWKDRNEPGHAEIKVSILKSDVSLRGFIDGYLRLHIAHGAQVLERQPFITAAQLDGTRVLLQEPFLAGVDDTPMFRAFYCFDGGSNQKIVVMCSCPPSNSGYYRPLFDASIKTFSLE